MAEKLRWYRRHQHTVLDYRHRFLAATDDSTIDKWNSTLRRAQLELLNNARRYHETEVASLQTNQSKIHTWLNKYMVLRSGRHIGPGLRRIQHQPPCPDWMEHSLPPTHNGEEYEFDWSPAPSGQG